MTEPTKFTLTEDRIPTHWVNLLPDLPGAATAFVVADQTVAARWFEPLASSLGGAGLGTVPLIVPEGEAAKTLRVYETLLHQLATQEAHRDDVVVALGGGHPAGGPRISLPGADRAGAAVPG